MDQFEKDVLRELASMQAYDPTMGLAEHLDLEDRIKVLEDQIRGINEAFKKLSQAVSREPVKRDVEIREGGKVE